MQAELTLNLLRTSRHDPTKSAFEVLEGKFNWNATPLAPPGTKALIYEAPSRRAAWAPHAVDGWYLGPAMNHYRCGLYFIESTRATQIAATTKLFPTHCPHPTLSEDDKTLLAAEELVRALEGALSLPTEMKVKHAKIVKQLTDILKNRPPPRVDSPTPPRVGTPTTSHDATAPRVVRQKRPIHQRNTRSNTPMPAIPEEPEIQQEVTQSEWSDEWYKTPREKSEKKNENTRKTQISPTEFPKQVFYAPLPKMAPPPRVPVVSQDEEEQPTAPPR